MSSVLGRILRWLRNTPDYPDTEPTIDHERILAEDPALQQLEQAHRRVRELSDRMGAVNASGVNSADLIRGRYLPRRRVRPQTKGA